MPKRHQRGRQGGIFTIDVRVDIRLDIKEGTMAEITYIKKFKFIFNNKVASHIIFRFIIRPKASNSRPKIVQNR